MKRKLASVLALAAAAALVLSGCSATGGGGNEKKNLVLVSPLTCGTSDYWQSICDGFTDAGKKLSSKYNVTVKAIPFGDLSKFLDLVSTVIAQKPDAIAVIPQGQDAMVPVLNQAHEAGIDVVIIDNDVPGFKNTLSFIGTDNKAAGAAAGKWITSGEKPLKSDKIAMLTQPPGQAQSVDDRAAGFKDVVKAAGLQIVSEQPQAGCDAAEGRSAVENILTAHPDVAGIFSVCDLGGVGAAQALEAAGIKDIATVGIDGQSTAVKLILGNKGYDASVAQFPRKMGSLAVQAMVDALEGRKVEKRIDTGTEVVTHSNAEAFLANNDGYTPAK